MTKVANTAFVITYIIVGSFIGAFIALTIIQYVNNGLPRGCTKSQANFGYTEYSCKDGSGWFTK